MAWEKHRVDWVRGSFGWGVQPAGFKGRSSRVPLDERVLAGNRTQDLISWNKEHIKTCVVSV